MAQRDEERSAWAGAIGWFALAAALRFTLLGRFSLWGDEVYSLDNALKLFTPAMRPSDLSFPLFYLIERVVLEISGLAGQATPDPVALQWALRLVPALAGAAAAGGIFVCSRGFATRFERHVLAAFVTFSPWLLFFSQWARFYTLLFALIVPATFELLRAARDASVRRGVAGSVWLLLATLVHPTAPLLLVGHVAAALVAAALRIRPLNRGLVPPLLLPLVLGAPALFWPQTLEPLLYKWSAHDAGVESASSLLLGVGFNVGPLVAALAFLGIPSLWSRDRALAVHCVVGTGVPFVLLVALAVAGKSVEQRYLLAVLPLALVPAAVFVRELADLAAERAGAPRFAVPVLAVLPYAPGVVSEFVDGDRHDLAGAAAIVRAQMGEGDGVIAETHSLFARYLPSDFPDALLLEAPPLPTRKEDRQQFDAMWKSCPRIWIVVQAEFESMAQPERAFQDWAWREGRLVRELWRPRLDYHQNRLRVFVVDTAHAVRWIK